LRGRECGSSWTSPLLFPSLFCLGGALAVFLELEEGEASEGGGGGMEVVRKEKGFAVAVERVSFPSRSPRIGKQLSQLLSRARARLSLSVCCNCLPAPIRATCARAALPFQRRKRSARKRGAGEQEQREEREAQQHVVTSQGAEPAFSSSASLLLFSTCLCSIRLVSRGSLGSTLSPFSKNREEREREQMHRGPGRERVEKGESETILRRQWRRVARARLCILFGRACERAVRHCSLCRRLLSDDSGRAQRRRREEEQHARLSACVPACEKGGCN